jgi:hypothetical protein
VDNQLDIPLHKFAIQMKKNLFGLKTSAKAFPLSNAVSAGQKSQVSMSVESTVAAKAGASDDVSKVHAAVKNIESGKVLFFTIPLTAHVISGAKRDVTKQAFIGAWRSIPSEKEKTERFNGLKTQNLDEIQKILSAQHMFFIAKRVPNPQQVVLYFYSYLLDDTLVLLELTFKPGVDACQVCVKSKQAQVAPIFFQSIKAAITN